MKARLALALSFAAMLATAASADTTIVSDNFDDYVDSNAFRAVWVPTHGLGTAASLPADDQAGILTDDPLSTFDFGPLLQGKAVDHIGALATSPPEIPSASMVNQWKGPLGIGTTPAFQIQPSATQKVFLSYDIFDSAQSGSERMTVGLRKTVTEADNANSPADPDTLPDADTSNILELGFWNANPVTSATVPIFPGAPTTTAAPTVPVSTQYAFRVINFGTMTGVKQGEAVTPYTPQPNWQFFKLPAELDRNADGLVAVSDVGAGWHQYTATISPTEVRLTLDLFRDGLRNTSRDPVTPGGNDRPGTPGVDAEVIIEINTIVTGLGAGFNNLRLGGPSGNSSAAGTGSTQAFDNVVLKLIDVVAPPSNNADFDSSGTVDGKDFLTWQEGFGLTGQTDKTHGNANADTVVDGADLAEWAAKFGGAPGSANATPAPEPGSVALALLALTGLATARRRLA